MSDEHKNKLITHVFAAMDMADWIYHDERLDIDGQATTRTYERIKRASEAFGWGGLFGLAGAWSIKSYWRMEDAFRRVGNPNKPAFVPSDLAEHVPNDDSRKRAYVSAQQFIAAVTADDFDMAEAIFNAAYDAGLDDVIGLLYCVLILSIRISTIAKNMRAG